MSHWSLCLRELNFVFQMPHESTVAHEKKSAVDSRRATISNDTTENIINNNKVSSNQTIK